MNSVHFLTVLLVAGVLTAHAEFTAPIPALLTTAQGASVTTAETWEKTRRPELLDCFQQHVFGRTPIGRPAGLRFESAEPDRIMMEGKALRKRINIIFQGPGGTGTIHMVAFIPKQQKPAPAFLLICNRPPEKNIDPDRRERSPFWPAEEIVGRGYAAIAFWNGDVAPDQPNMHHTGAHGIFQPDVRQRQADSWGTLAAWAWGASRIMDWIESEPLLDAKHVAVIGHSRGGKTALWCGANDPRFALTISNDSGCGGAKLHRMNLPQSESIAIITERLGYWFCDTFKRYANNENALPVDQHQLLALMAPRLLYVASARGDAWAGPEGEFASCVLASPAWELYGKRGLESTQFPALDTPYLKGSIGYHIRTGKHDLTLYDWTCYMDFTDRHGWR